MDAEIQTLFKRAGRSSSKKIFDRSSSMSVQKFSSPSATSCSNFPWSASSSGSYTSRKKLKSQFGLDSAVFTMETITPRTFSVPLSYCGVQLYSRKGSDTNSSMHDAFLPKNHEQSFILAKMTKPREEIYITKSWIWQSPAVGERPTPEQPRCYSDFMHSPYIPRRVDHSAPNIKLLRSRCKCQAWLRSSFPR